MNRIVSPLLRRLIAGRAFAKESALDLEKVSSADTITASAADEVLHRTANQLQQVPADQLGDPAEYRRAIHILLARADKGLRTMLPGARHTEPDTAFALEAVIHADGTRPSFLIKQGACDPTQPLAANWKQQLTDNAAVLAKRIAAVGRIQPSGATATNYFGTGWLVDRDKGLVLTNLHVLEQMWGRLSNRMLPDGKGGYNFLGDAAFIDFVAESGSLEQKQFRIVNGVPSGIDGTGFRRLDFAVLRIEPLTDELPEAIPVVADTDAPVGNTTSFCFVGYPGPPPYTNGIADKVDWAWVTKTLFGNRFGVKRLAPGTTSTPLGSVADDPQRWVFGHDATTLGGSSGSPALDWLNGNVGGVGLHFAGATSITNCAHAIVKIRAELEKRGVTVLVPD